MRKSVKIILISIVAILIIYLVPCLYMSFKLDKLVQSSYESYGKNNAYAEIISDKLFSRLNYRRYESEYKVSSVEKNTRTFPLTLWLGNKAYSMYEYTYERTDSENRSLCGSYKIPVTIIWEIKNWKWVIIEKQENP